MGRKKGIKNKVKAKDKPKEIESVNVPLPDLKTTENIKGESFIESLNNEIPDTSESESESEGETPKLRIPKKERERIELENKLNNLTDTDFKNYGETIGAVFDIISVRLGDKWKLNDSEKMAIGKPLSRVAVKYIGDFKYYDELTLGIVLTGIILPRIKSNE